MISGFEDGNAFVNREKILKAAYFAVLAIDQEPSRRSVQKMAKAICGKAIQTADVLAWLRDFRAPVPLQYRDSTATVPQPVLKSIDLVPLPYRASTLSRARHKVLESQIEIQTDLRQSGDGGDEKKKLTERENAKSKQKQADLSWVLELRAATAALAAVPLRNLTLEERLVCGRYHAFRFGNCTRSEPTNRKAGAKAAAAFAKMADSRIFGSFTVRDYVDHAVVYQRDFMGGAPFYDPFLIRAVIEAQPVAVGGAR